MSFYLTRIMARTDDKKEVPYIAMVGHKGIVAHCMLSIASMDRIKELGDAGYETINTVAYTTRFFGDLQPLLSLKSSVNGIVGLRKALFDSSKVDPVNNLPICYFHSGRDCLIIQESYYDLMTEIFKDYHKKFQSNLSEDFFGWIDNHMDITVAKRAAKEFDTFIKNYTKTDLKTPKEILELHKQQVLKGYYTYRYVIGHQFLGNKDANANKAMECLYIWFGKNLKIFPDFPNIFTIPIVPIKDLFSDFCSTNTERKFISYGYSSKK